MKNTKTGTSWSTITIWLILFWPVGIYMLIKKLSVDKSAIINGSQAPKITAGILFFISFVTFIAPIRMTEGGESLGAGMTIIVIVVSIAFAIGGFKLLKVIKETNALAIEFKKYLNIVINGKVTNISEIASGVGVSHSVAEEKVQRMIDLQIFKGAYIDYKAGELILGAKPVQPNVEYVSITCPNCAASQNIIKGRNNICAYCNSALG